MFLLIKFLLFLKVTKNPIIIDPAKNVMLPLVLLAISNKTDEEPNKNNKKIRINLFVYFALEVRFNLPIDSKAENYGSNYWI